MVGRKIVGGGMLINGQTPISNLDALKEGSRFVDLASLSRIHLNLRGFVKVIHSA